MWMNIFWIKCEKKNPTLTITFYYYILIALHLLAKTIEKTDLIKTEVEFSE